MEHNGLVDAYDTYDILLNYWADTMQDDCYMISNDGWTYPEVKSIKVKEVKEKKNKKDNGSDTESNKSKTKEIPCMYDEIVCDLLPVNIILDEYFSDEKHHIDILKAKQEEIESLIQELTEEHEDDFNGYDKVNEIRAAYIVLV